MTKPGTRLAGRWYLLLRLFPLRKAAMIWPVHFILLPEARPRSFKTFATSASVCSSRRRSISASTAGAVMYFFHAFRASQQAQTKLVPVTVTAEPNGVTLPGIAPVTAPSGSIHIELPGRAVISVEAGVDPELVRTVLGSLLR
jgi:hypothetical protein